MRIQAKIRTTSGRQVGKLRSAGQIPAVVYGHGFNNEIIVLNELEFTQVLDKAGESTLVDLLLADQEPYKVLVQDVQRDPLTDRVRHVDLRRVRMDEKVEAEVSLEFVGQSPAVKELGGIMVTSLNSLHIKALPQDLIHEIKVDVSGLRLIGDIIRVAQLEIPDRLEVLNKPDTTVIMIEAPRKVEEVEAAQSPEVEEAAKVKAAAGEEEETGKEDQDKDKDKKEKSTEADKASSKDSDKEKK